MSKRLVADDGIICGDDLELQSHQVDTTIALHQPDLDKCEDKNSKIVYHPGVTRAVAENFGRVSSWHGFLAMQKNGGNWHRLSLEGMPAHIPSYLTIENLIGLKALLMEHGIL